jgi:hypothetical protein
MSFIRFPPARRFAGEAIAALAGKWNATVTDQRISRAVEWKEAARN